MGFKDKFKEELRDKLTEEELSLLPRGFQTLGKTIILKLKPELYDKKELISDACLRLFPSTKSIYLNRGKISGVFREPEKIEHLAGVNNPLVEHTEHGIKYRFDITFLMGTSVNSQFCVFHKNGKIKRDSLNMAPMSVAEKEVKGTRRPLLLVKVLDQLNTQRSHSCPSIKNNVGVFISDSDTRRVTTVFLRESSWSSNRTAGSPKSNQRFFFFAWYHTCSRICSSLNRSFIPPISI